MEKFKINSEYSAKDFVSKIFVYKIIKRTTCFATLENLTTGEIFKKKIAQYRDENESISIARKNSYTHVLRA